METDVPLKKRPKQEKNEPPIKMESQNPSEKIMNNSSLGPSDGFPQFGFPGFHGFEQLMPFQMMNGDLNAQFLNFFKAFTTNLQFQGLMNLERNICHQGLMFGEFFYDILS